MFQPSLKIERLFQKSVLPSAILFWNQKCGLKSKPILSHELFPKDFYHNFRKEENCKKDKKAQRKRIKEYRNSLYSREGVKDVDFSVLEDGGVSLSVGDILDEHLEDITILTPTADRRDLFALAIRNYLSFHYPNRQIYWVILDNGKESIKEIVPRNKKVSYHYIDPGIEGKWGVAKMRNWLVEQSKTSLVAFMDDDDYYPPESLLARAKCLIKYETDGIQCVGCRDYASYDLITGTAALCSNGADYLSEASLCFRKSFWERRPFREKDTRNEARYYLEARQSQLRSIPFQYVTIAFTHHTNTTGNVRSLDFRRKYLPNVDWEDTKQQILSIMDTDTQEFIESLKKRIIPVK